jgi:hypothetical protein
LRRSTRWAVLGLLTLFLFGALEVAARGYWRIIRKLPPEREGLWRGFFPEWGMSGIDRVASYHGDGTFDVLILGASVVHFGYGDVGPRLGAALEKRLGRPVRVINLAYPGRTTRDSRMKYERLGDRRFDLVIVYHGINDVFLNNCPPGDFRADYTHRMRFAQLAALDRHAEVGWFTLPYTAYYAVSSFLGRSGLTKDNPRVSFNHYGSDIRTPSCFEENMEAIARLAEQRGDPLLLMTFAYHLPPDYTEEAFAARRLDYGSHDSAVSQWGEPANVTRTLDLHNEVIRRVAARHGLPLVEQRRLMPTGKRYFNDLCHLTSDGCAAFVDNIMTHLDFSRVGRHDAR